MPNLRNVGTHDTGFFDRENRVSADSQPLSSNKNVNEAIASAKNRTGAELVIVNADGTANTHALAGQDGFKKENKHILISELDRDPRSNSKPLAINDKVAEAFGGKGAFLIDEKSNVTYLGQDVDIATSKSKLQEAVQYLKSPTAEKTNAAYAIAKDAGNEGHIDTTMGKQVLADLKSNYHGTDAAADAVSFLKPGKVQTKVLALTESLSKLSGQENARVSDLKQELSSLTQTFNTNNAKATSDRDKALSAWKSADNQHSKTVSQSASVLREKRMPGIHKLEDTVQAAKQTHGQADQNHSQAASAKRNAESKMNELERLPASADAHLEKARRLENENRNIYIQMQTYTSRNLSHVRNEMRSIEYQSRDVSADLDAERRKPSPPSSGGGNNNGDPFGNDPFNGGSGNNSGNGNSGDPFGKDPFNGGGGNNSGNGNSGDPFGKDPFNGGGGNNSGNGNSGDPFGKDPFNGGGSGGGGKYRDSGRIRSLESKLNLLKTEYRDLRQRETGLETVSTRLALTQNVDQLSLIFLDLTATDKMALGRYGDQQKKNNRSIKSHNQSAEQDNNRYRNEIRGAQRNLSEATQNESTAQEQLNDASHTLRELNRDLEALKASPRSDSHAQVKGAAQTHQRNLKNQADTVGPQAPLTLKRDGTQQQLNNLQGAYNQEKGSLESGIANVKATLNNEAMALIQDTETAIR